MADLGAGVYARRVKRPVDLIAGGALLILSAPLHGICAAAVALLDGRPVYYAQVRTGRDGIPFRLPKFRTMAVDTERVSGGYPTEDMVTRSGRFLRRYSLDELPQLISVVQGDMSLVGPRPALPSQTERYTARQRRRLGVRPGLTGLAQVRFRNEAPWSVRIESDIEYIEQISFRLDLRILLLTVRKVLSGADMIVGQMSTEVDDLAPAAPSAATAR
jgi:lipopolysaccharide/colanic/teichoic acid biosynthesis glycosyltransferase